MSVGVLFCKKLNKNVYRELIGQQTARQPMEKYNVHLTFKSEKKIIAKILKLIIKPIAKVSFFGQPTSITLCNCFNSSHMHSFRFWDYA